MRQNWIIIDERGGYSAMLYLGYWDADKNYYEVECKDRKVKLVTNSEAIDYLRNKYREERWTA